MLIDTSGVSIDECHVISSSRLIVSWVYSPIYTLDDYWVTIRIVYRKQGSSNENIYPSTDQPALDATNEICEIQGNFDMETPYEVFPLIYENNNMNASFSSYAILCSSPAQNCKFYYFRQ